MKFRAILATILVVFGIGAVLVLTRSTRSEAVSSTTDDAVSSIPSVAPAAVKPTSVQSASANAPVGTGVPVVLPQAQTPTARGTLPFLVKSSVPIDKPVRLAIEAMGARSVSTLSRHTLLVDADASVRTKLRSDKRFSESSEFLPSAKLSPELAQVLSSGIEQVQATVVSLTPADRASVRAAVVQGGGEILTGCLESDESFSAKLPTALVADLAGRGEVRWMETFSYPHLMNDEAVKPAAMNVSDIWLSDENPGGLSGTNQVITTSDSGIDTGILETLHEDLRDRVIGFKVANSSCSTNDISGHGTHTAGSIVGNGTLSEGRYRGTAWGAQLWAWFCGYGARGVRTPSSIDDLLRPEKDKFSAYIHSASWGSDTEGAYNSQCKNFDTYLWSTNNIDFLPVIANGNAGEYGEQTVGSPAAAKNVLSVGATQNWPLGDPKFTAYFSSRGPCADGRIKPDVAAPGHEVTSTRSSLTAGEGPYTQMSGTSMACPLTAGSVALIREWLLRRDEFADEETDTAKRPTAALMKAIIMGGAKDAATPNNNQGWGRVDIKETLYPTDRAVKLVDRIPFMAGSNYIWVVETTNAAPLDVQLVWIDYPGSTANTTGPQLVNDLDLTVEKLDEDGYEIHYGNGGSEPDTLNNAESVHIASAKPTKYVISVDCKFIQHDCTEGGAAALYIRGAFDPEAEVAEPERVRIRERGLGFWTLNRALAQVQADDTVEVLHPVPLYGLNTIASACTITATNEDAQASAVTCVRGATLAVGDARLSLTNVIFAGESPMEISVSAGGTLAVGGEVGVGRIVTSSETGVELAGVLTQPITVDSPNRAKGGRFGVCSAPEAASCANMFLNAWDEVLGGLVNGENQLVWGEVPVPDAAAVVRLAQSGETVNFRSLSRLLSFVTNDADIAVVSDCTLTNTCRISKRLSIGSAGTTPARITPPEGFGGAAGFVIEEGGSMTISNLTFVGFKSAQEFLYVDGGDLLLEDGTTLEELETTIPCQYGPVFVRAGSFTLRSGAAIRNCVSAGEGGGLCAYGGTITLEGGTITGCRAESVWDGGGIYARPGVVLKLSGDIAVSGNTVKNDTVVQAEDIQTDDDRTAYESDDPIQIVAPLSGQAKASIGVHSSRREIGAAFATYDKAALTEKEAKRSAKVFFCNGVTDAGEQLVGKAVDGEFVWGLETLELEDDELDRAVIRVITAAGVTNYYASAADAFSSIGDDCTVELMKDGIVFASDLTVDRNIVLRSDPGQPLCQHLVRSHDAELVVSETGALTMTNVCVDAGMIRSIKPLVAVKGGSLTLDAGSRVTGVRTPPSFNSSARCASGVVVWRSGVLYMNAGARVDSCWNSSCNLDEPNTGTGGGILLDGGSTAYFRGGIVTGCRASVGGGVTVCNEAVAWVSDGFAVTNNLSSASQTTPESDDLVVEDKSLLQLASPLAETAAIGRSAGYKAESNEVARVPEWASQWTDQELAADAAKFIRNPANSERGVVVTNETADALVVWKTFLAEDGSYEAADGTVYHVIETTPGPTPPGPTPPPTPVEVQPKPIAFMSIVKDADIVTLVITDAVQWCNYRVFATNTLEGGFAITNAAGAFIVKPVTNFQWTTTDREIELQLPATDTQRFWKATAAPGTEQTP